jgi:uncharacterized protein YndB with AHSA1/START domain
MSDEVPDSVRKSLTVNAPQALAWQVFTAQMSLWWPLSTHKIGAAAAVEAVVEPRAGGRWYERGDDGSTCDWGTVVVWDPPSRLVLTWDIGADWRPSPGLGTEVEVRFIAEEARRTRVELEHRGFERYGPRAHEMRRVFDSEGDWGRLLQLFAKVAVAAQE